MPVDFSRVPPRSDVPDASRPSILAWVLLLGLILASGVAIAIFVWPASKPDALLFWFFAVGFPILAWGFLLSCRFAYLYGCVNAALAMNRTSDAIETRCHESSSQPLAVLGHVWKFSSSDEENGIDALVDGKIALRPVSSQAAPNTDVIARWLDVPGRQFYAGNASTEHVRQTAVCEWLLNQLMLGIAPQLRGLSHMGTVYVDFCLDSVLDQEAVGEHLLFLLRDALRTSRVKMNSPGRGLSLFHADSWFDDIREDATRLLIAIQLRNAVSEILAGGVAEAGSMLLVSSLPVAQKIGQTSPVYIHRPAKGASENVTDTVRLAIRWGRARFDKIETNWRTGLTRDVARTVRSSCDFGRGTETVSLDTTIGNAGAASGWLATTLAVANAAMTNGPQLVIAQEGDDVIALVCEKQT